MAVSFELGGESFKCLDRMPLGVALDFFGDQTAEDDWVAAYRLYREFLRGVLVPDDEARFDAVLRRKDDPVQGVDLEQAVMQTIEAYTARPTERPSSSEGGPRIIETSSTPAPGSPGKARSSKKKRG